MALKLVIDSSVIVKWLNNVNEDHIRQADRILADALKGNVELIAPELAKYEVGNVLLSKKKLSSQDIEFPIRALYEYPIQFISETAQLAKDTYDLASNIGITYYDASFMSL